MGTYESPTKDLTATEAARATMHKQSALETNEGAVQEQRKEKGEKDFKGTPPIASPEASQKVRFRGTGRKGKSGSFFRGF